MLVVSYVVTALNPKSIAFFIAFVPQFVDPAGPLVMQFVILEATFVSFAAANVLMWALLVGQIRPFFLRRSTLKTVHRIGGSFLVCAGILAAITRRAA